MQRVHAQLGKGAHRKRGDPRVVAFVQVEAPAQGYDLPPAKPAGNQLATVADDRRLGKAREYRDSES